LSLPNIADTRIGVTVVTGFLGSGKTTLLNRMVATPRFARAAVVVNEFGAVGIDHHLVRHVSDTVRVVEGGCICCMVRGGVADTLRDLFLLAVRRAIQPFGHVLIETSGLASPAPVLFTLRHEAFLAERYSYNGTIALADAQHVVAQIRQQPEAAQQLALADEVAISKADLASPAQVQAATAAILRLNPATHVHVLGGEAALPAGLLAERLYRGPRPPGEGSAWLARYGAPRPLAGPRAERDEDRPGRPVEAAPHDVAVATLVLPGPVPRAAFLRGMASLQAELGQNLLRMKGLVLFEGDTGPSAVHGVHDQLYPPVPLPEWPDEEAESRLVFIARGVDENALYISARRHLRGN
jgi:G3E family GTPase